MTRDELQQAIADTLAEIEAVKQQIEKATDTVEELLLMRHYRPASCGTWINWRRLKRPGNESPANNALHSNYTVTPTNPRKPEF